MEIEKTIKPVMDHTVADAILDAEKAKEYCKKSCDEKGLTKAVKEVVAENQPDSHDETVKDVSEAEAVITESCKVEEDTYMLKPEFDSRKSFYKKAKVIDEDGVKLLYSYSTPVCAIIEGEGVILLENPHGYYRLGYDASPTTLRHVREFLKQNGFEVYPVAQLPLHYPVENFTSLDDLKSRAIIGAEDVELQEGKETSQDILYLKDRKDLAEAISCCKKDGRKFRVTRTCKEGYRYELVKEPIEVLKDLIDVTTTDDTAVISEKGQTENPDAPKIEVEISAEDKEILDTTFAASEETGEESEPQEDTDIEEIEIEDEDTDEIEVPEDEEEDVQLAESLRSDKPTVGDLVEFLRDTADELEMNYDSDTKIRKVSNTYFLGHPNFFLGISGSYTGGFINLDSPVDEDEEDIEDDQLDESFMWYISYLHQMIKQEEEALKRAKDDKVKAAIQRRLDAFKADLEAVNKNTSLKEDKECFFEIVFKEKDDDEEKTERYEDDLDGARADFLHMTQEESDNYQYVVLRKVCTDYNSEEEIEVIDSFGLDESLKENKNSNVFYVEIEDNQNNTLAIIEIKSAKTKEEACKKAKRLFIDWNDIDSKIYRSYGMKAFVIEPKYISKEYIVVDENGDEVDNPNKNGTLKENFVAKNAKEIIEKNKDRDNVWYIDVKGNNGWMSGNTMTQGACGYGGFYSFEQAKELFDNFEQIVNFSEENIKKYHSEGESTFEPVKVVIGFAPIEDEDGEEDNSFVMERDITKNESLKEGKTTISKAEDSEEDIEDEEIGDLTSGIFSLGDLSDEDLDDLDKNTIEPTIDIPGEDSESVFEYLVNLYDLYLAEPESLTTGEIALLKKQGLISDEEYEDGGDDLPVDFKNISSDPTFGLEDDDFDAAELQEEKVVCDPEDTCCGEPNCEHKHNACHDDSCDDECCDINCDDEECGECGEECCDDTCKTELESDSTSETDIEWPEDDEVIEAPVKTEKTIELPNDTVEVEQKENKIEIEITPKETEEEDDIVADDTVEDDLLEMASSYINYIKK